MLEILWLLNNYFRLATVQDEQYLKSEMWQQKDWTY